MLAKDGRSHQELEGPTDDSTAFPYIPEGGISTAFVGGKRYCKETELLVESVSYRFALAHPLLWKAKMI